MCFGVFTLHSAPYGADNSVGEGYKHRAPPEQGPKQQNRSFSGKATYTEKRREEKLMSKDIPPLKAAFNSQLVDASGQPNLVKNSSQLDEVFWILLNNQTAELVVKPLGANVDENHYNFLFEFSPGVFTRTPVLEGWDVYATKDNDGRILSLYVALSGSQNLSIAPNATNKAALTYSDAIPKDPGLNTVNISLTTGQNVYLGGHELPPSTYSFFISLVQGNTPMISAPPLAVGFVGRRTVLNDGHSNNDFAFALTNMTEAPLSLTPDVLFTVWFDAAPDQPNKAYPAALARIEDLTANDFLLTPPDKWRVIPPIKAADQVPGNPQWQIRVTENLALDPQDPAIFKFGVLRTPLDPGMSRMYLQIDGLPGFRPFVLLAQLEKTPLSYGSIHGQGLYLSAAGNLTRENPQDLTKESGLYVQQTGNGPAAIFNGGNVGIGTETNLPAAKLHIMDSDQNLDGGTVIVGTSSGPTLRFGCESSYAWIQSYSAPLVINAAPRPMGIGIATPGSTLSVNGGVAIGNTFAQKNTTVGENELAVEKKIGIGVTTPGSALSVVGGAAIGKAYAQITTHVAENNLAVEGSVGIGTSDPGSDLSVAGGVAIGTTYALKATNKKIAANNLAVQGKVGIGTNDPSNQLDVESEDGIRFSLKRGGQLLIGANNDKSVQLVAAGPKGGSSASADFMYLGGSATPNQGLPKMILNATEVDVQATTTAISGDLTMSGDINVKGTKVINLGSDVPGKEVSAGRIAYALWTTGALDIVGAGTQGGERNIKLWDNIYVPGNIWQFMQYNQRWMALWPSGSSTGAWYNFGPQSSDLNLKSDVQTVSAALDKVRRLAAVTFRWNESALARFTGDIEKTISAGPEATEEEQQKVWKAERERRRKELETPRLGVIAQDVEAVLPEAVTTDPDGFKSVHYDQLIALLIEAVKEQDQVVTAQAATLERLQVEIQELKQAILKDQ